MRKKKSAIVSGIILLVGILMIFAGIYGADILGRINSNQMLDPFNITKDDVNKVYDFKVTDNCAFVEENYGFYTYIEAFDNGKDYEEYEGSTIGIKIKHKDLAIFERAVMRPNSLGSILTGKICDDNGATKRKVANYMIDFYNDLIDYSPEFAANLDDNWQEIVTDEVCPYFIMLQPKETNMVPFYCLTALGILVIIAAIITFINKVFGVKVKHIFLAALSVILILAIVLGITLIGKIRTYMSITDEAPGKGFYKMNIHYNMKTDKFLNSNVASVDDFISWIGDNQLYGLPIKMDTTAFGCSTFTTKSPEGDTLFGRNFDYFENDALIVYSDPSDGYSSIGVVATNIFGLDSSIVNADSAIGKLVMMITPYATLDGMNEAGLGIGILELSLDEIHQDNGKPDLLIFAALRCILDSCANVDEALELLESHDIHSSLGAAYHLYITDKSGRSVVVEWLDNEMVVTEDNACTNYIIAPGEHYGDGGIDSRYDIVKESLDNASNVLSKEESMRVLESVTQSFNSGGTEWSCVYNLDDFTVDICLDSDFGTVYMYSPEDFK